MAMGIDLCLMAVYEYLHVYAHTTVVRTATHRTRTAICTQPPTHTVTITHTRTHSLTHAHIHYHTQIYEWIFLLLH